MVMDYDGQWLRVDLCDFLSITQVQQCHGPIVCFRFGECVCLVCVCVCVSDKMATCHDVTWDPTRRHTSKQADTTIYDCASRCGKFLPYVRLPKYGAMPPLRPFELCDSSFESPWRLKLYSTSLNLQIGVVVEIKPS